ncbi:hypothetical protein DFH06DRAFT_1126037 [Mycena polygramma]|nr:hypothetical protein DFH06DRAFT_1126037 [Mycena polygramma]
MVHADMVQRPPFKPFKATAARYPTAIFGRIRHLAELYPGFLLLSHHRVSGGQYRTPSDDASLQCRPRDIPHRLAASLYAQRLKAASLATHEPLNTWILDNLESAGWIINIVYPSLTLDPAEVLCTVRVSYHQTSDDRSIFSNPDVYLLWLFADVQHILGKDNSHTRSPTVLLGRFEGFKDDGDAPGWSRTMEPGERYRFTYSRSFLAALFCGKTLGYWDGLKDTAERRISSEMLTWACATAAGTEDEDSILEHSENWRNNHSVRTHSVAQAVKFRWVRGILRLSFQVLPGYFGLRIVIRQVSSIGSFPSRLNEPPFLMQPLPLFFRLPNSSVGEELLAREWFINAGNFGGGERICLRGLHVDVVRCTLEIDVPVMETAAGTRTITTLFVTAGVSNRLGVSDDICISPQAIVDQFIGTASHPDAPRWLSWTGARRFPMSRSGFIGLFVSMAMWPENLWAAGSLLVHGCMVSFNLRACPHFRSTTTHSFQLQAGTWAEIEHLGPATPLKPSVPQDQKKDRKQLRENAYWRRRRNGDLDDTPSRSRGTSSPLSEDNWSDGGAMRASGYYTDESDVVIEPIRFLVVFPKYIGPYILCVTHITQRGQRSRYRFPPAPFSRCRPW